MMKFKTTLLAVLTACLWCVAAQAAELPEPIKDLVPLYPEAKITTTSTAGVLTTVKFETKAEPEAVFQFYKKTMTERGWKTLHEQGGNNNTRLVMVKDDLQFGFGSHSVQGSGTRFFFSIKQLAAGQQKPNN